MGIKVVLAMLLAVFAYAEDSWYSKWGVEVEAGIFLNEFDGDLRNATSRTDFADELLYKDSYASYFGLKIDNDYDFVPVVHISLIDMKQEKDAILQNTEEVAGWNFKDSVSSEITYRVINAVFHNSYKIKGAMQKFLRWRYYSGDIEFNLGVNIKYIDYTLKIKNNWTTVPEPYAFVNVNTFVALPYIGAKYYWYDFAILAEMSALSVSETKARHYQVGAEYRVYNDLFLNASYVHEDFQATEKKDKVDFKTYGTKFSFKYVF